MTTFVLGAGASVHAGYPLAGKLGDALRDWIHGNKPPGHEYRIHIDQLHKHYGGLGNIEQILTDFDECGPDSPVASIKPPIRANLLHDLRFSIREFFVDLGKRQAALYRRFARQRVQPNDVLITFNYDWMLERELKKAGLWEIDDGYGFSIGLPTIPRSRVAVLKLHGSINWWGINTWGRGYGLASSASLCPRPVILCGSDFEALGYPDVLGDPKCAGLSSAAAFPAIIMPTRRKHFYFKTSLGPELKDFWDALWEQARHALNRSDEIAIIGFRMADADERAGDLLLEESNRDAHITICCGRTNATIRKKLHAHGFQRITATEEGRFEEYLDYLPGKLERRDILTRSASQDGPRQ